MKARYKTESHRQVQIHIDAIPTHILTPIDAHRHPNDESTWYHPPCQTPPQTAVREQNFHLVEQYKHMMDDLVE